MPQPPPQMTAAQMRTVVLNQIKQLKSDGTQSYNPYSLQKILMATLDVIEFLVSGQISSAHPNQVPGQSIAEDPNKTRVQLFQTPEQVAAAATAPSVPVVNGDVQFTRTSGQGAVGGQTVELYGGPAGSPNAGGDNGGQRVEFFGQPAAPAQQPAQIPPGYGIFMVPPGTIPPPPLAGYALPPGYALYPLGPPQGYAPPQGYVPPQPMPAYPTAAPAVAQPVNNPPTAQFMPGAPPFTVEAGHAIPVAAAPGPVSGLPVAGSFADIVGAGAQRRSESPVPIQGSPVSIGVSRTREELITMLPIPGASPNG